MNITLGDIIIQQKKISHLKKGLKLREKRLEEAIQVLQRNCLHRYPGGKSAMQGGYLVDKCLLCGYESGVSEGW